jgi:glutamate 5-kinase
VHDVAHLEVDTSTSGTRWGTGGMATKLTAARIACAAGCSMAICNSERPEAVEEIVAGERRGTVFHPICAKMKDRKRWILSGVRSLLAVVGCPSKCVWDTEL